jgi:clan AA aspartic protease (TIGR02281 family)
MLKYIALIAALALPLTAQAKLYKIVDENGKISFTDTPPAMDAKEHKLSNITSIGNPEFNMGKLNLTIPYLKEGGAIIVNGSINGIVMRFVVDTGATFITVPPHIAKQAGLLLTKTENIKLQTANGEILAPKVSIKTVLIHKAKQNNVDAIIQSISTKDADLGLLGMSFFSHYKMTIHQDKKEIQLEAK